MNLALLFKRQGRLADALARLGQAVRCDPPPSVLADLDAERIHLLFLGRDYRAAAKACDALLALRPDEAETYGMRRPCPARTPRRRGCSQSP